MNQIKYLFVSKMSENPFSTWKIIWGHWFTFLSIISFCFKLILDGLCSRINFESERKNMSPFGRVQSITHKFMRAIYGLNSKIAFSLITWTF